MTAPSKNWVNVADTQVDADSPLDTTLITALRDDLVHLKEWLGYGFTSEQAHNHDGVNSKIVSQNDISKNEVLFSDDFLLPNIVGWTVLTGANGGGAAIVAGESGKISIVNDNIALNVPYGISTVAGKPWLIYGGNTLIFEAVVVASNTGFEVNVGLIDNNTTSIGVNHIRFSRYQTTSGGNWASSTRAASVSTVTDLGLTPNSARQTLRFEATASSVLFYIDGVLKATHTTNIPTVALGVRLSINAGGPGQSYLIDKVSVSSNVRI